MSRAVRDRRTFASGDAGVNRRGRLPVGVRGRHKNGSGFRNARREPPVIAALRRNEMSYLFMELTRAVRYAVTPGRCNKFRIATALRANVADVIPHRETNF